MAKPSAILAVAVLALAFAVPAEATGGSMTFRYLLVVGGPVPLAHGCPGAYYDPLQDPLCWLAKDTLGYDGVVVGAEVDVSGHRGHAFMCAVTSSTAPGVPVVGEFEVWFDTDGDGTYDRKYGPGEGVSGTVDGDRMRIVPVVAFVDATIDCTF